MGYCTHMKTTIDIADSILLRAKALASREKSTLRALTEEGLELVMQRREHPPRYRVKPVVFGGEGLSEEFKGGAWEQSRAAAYGERGG